MSERIAKTSGLSKKFGRHLALDGVSVEVERGDVIGVLGKNGAGKTTLLELLLGFGVPAAGGAEVFGFDSVSLPAAAKARIGFVPQQDELMDMLTGRQQLRITAAFHQQWHADLIDRLVADWEVPLDRPIRGLSVGERQKLSVLLALGHKPELLVLDEPVASLDHVARRRFLQALVNLTDGHDRAIVFSTHIVSDLERVANRLWIL